MQGADKERRRGYRCAVCRFCGRCFDDSADENPPSSDGLRWSGKRCDVCVGCGKCATAWGLVGSGETDAASGPTNWADAFKRLDTGGQPAPPVLKAAPGKVADVACSPDSGLSQDVDGATGATPGVAAACRDLGISKLDDALVKFGINPPGVA